jgi:hypothetical protein
VGEPEGTETAARARRDQLSRSAIVFLAVLVGVLEQVGRFMPAQRPRRHLDISWMMGLDLAREEGFKHGTDFVFTYGPWGFLASPTGIDLASQVASGTMRMIAVGLLFAALADTLRSWRLRVVVASALALLISNGGQPDWTLMLAIMVWTLTCVSRGVRVPLWALALVAAVAAFLFQVKLTVGLITLVMVALLVILHRRRVTALAASTGSFAVAFVLLWVLAGQSLTALPRWLRLGWEIVAGYGDAMAYCDANILMIFMVLAVLVAAVTTVTARGLGCPARLGLLGALLFFAKLALSLPDGGHLLPGYAGVAAVVTVLLGLHLPRPARWGSGGILVCLSLLLSIGSPVIPARDTSIEPFTTDTWGEGRADRLSSARAELIADLDVSAPVLAALENHPVSVDPWEISAVWAYDLEWRPLPVFQQYSAYTPRLDAENAAALLSDPERRVLRERVADHDHNPVWVTPAYTLALVCNFEAVATDGEWAALARGVDRCGEERGVSTHEVEADEEVTLEAPDSSLIAVRFVPQPRSLGDRLLGVTGVQRNLLHATLDGERYRVPEVFVAGPLIVGAPEGEAVLFDLSAATRISFDRAGLLEIVEIPLADRESE